MTIFSHYETCLDSSLKPFNPNRILNVNIEGVSEKQSNQLIEQYKNFGGSLFDSEIEFQKECFNERLKLSIQHQASELYNGLVVGDYNNSEKVIGFLVNGCKNYDVSVLNGLNTRQVVLMAKELGIITPDYINNLVTKIECEQGYLGRDKFEINCEFIDDFLEGLIIPKEVEEKIIEQYSKTNLKRNSTQNFIEDRELS